LLTDKVGKGSNVNSIEIMKILEYLEREYYGYSNVYTLATDLLCDAVTDNYNDLVHLCEALMDFTDLIDIRNAWNDFISV